MLSEKYEHLYTTEKKRGKEKMKRMNEKSCKASDYVC